MVNLVSTLRTNDTLGTSGTDLTQLEKAKVTYWKWGLTNSLPSSHPYKNSQPTV